MTAPIDIPLDAIITDEEAQLRVAGTSAEIVFEYAEAMENGVVFPPIVAFQDGDRYFPGDGFHRIDAARRNNLPTISAVVRQGTLRDAILHACGSNADHGLRRTAADKRRAIETLLRDPQWSKMSDRKIGETCRVDHKTVAAMRREMTGGEFPTAKPNGKGNGKASGEFPTAEPEAGRSMLDRLLATLSDAALVAECRRRGWEVNHELR